MTATLQGVQIGTYFYDTYADIPSADEYLEAASDGAAWRALTDEDTKARYLVSATRVLNALNWKGELVDPAQPLAWPRSGITDVDPTGVPQPIFDASIVLANEIANGIDIVNMTSTKEAQQKRLKAGSVEIEYFKASGLGGRQFPLPKPAWLLISPFLAGQGAAQGARACGTAGLSQTTPGYGHVDPL